MGAACCVAAKDKTVQSGSTRAIVHRTIRSSPTWSFRWDHRGRVAGEDASITWFSDGISRNDGSENKNEIPYVSEDGSPLQSDQRSRCQKYPISERSAALVINSTSDQSISMDVSMDANVEPVKELEELSTISCPSPTKPSSSLTPSSSLSASPLPSQSRIAPSTSTPSRLPHHSPGHQLSRQVSDSRVPGFKSPSTFYVSEQKQVFPSWSNESGMRSCDGSSYGWSVPGCSELMGISHRERWSFDSESSGFNHDRLLRSSSQFSTSPVDLQTCPICSKLLTEKSSWSSQKMIASNDLAVVSVLICGHVYHAECLESMTPETKKYDPACPVCTFGEKQILKLSEKALKAEMNLRARNKKSKNRIVDSEFDDDFVFDHFKDGGRQGQGLRMYSSSSGRRSFGKHFLRRHFSFGSKSSKSMLDNHPTRKKGFFWAKSSKQ
ncbi:putative transcription factor C2H2 family [Lupinus albus]|uniref:Putative transcription factor C2H2 family n=1 Tax=Lupinus albus TaxID=3870 RepID=A0A6A4R6N1_LUPAL|nr:putative transcription factor C2H2 family [Lupinus albus]